MKIVILAGGLGTRISEESHLLPKPMIEIGDMPVLWHVMKIYLYHGFNEFIICAGYKQHVIKKYFADYYLYNSDLTFDCSNDNKTIVHSNVSEPWKVTIVNTGLNTMTAGRLKRVQDYIGNETFMVTYGDGVGDVDIKKVLEFHRANKTTATLTAVQPGGRFGALGINNGIVESFKEKNIPDGGWINGGFVVVEPSVFDYIEGDDTSLEGDVFEKLAGMKQLSAYMHRGFWQCMDTLRDKRLLDNLINRGAAPWMKWQN